MKYSWLISVVFFMLLVFSFNSSQAQFYNGLQMEFGKNRVQYNGFVWQFFRFGKFDAYFYENGKELAEFTSKTAEKRLKEAENFFGYSLENRIIIVVYNRLSDFRQSNMGLVSGNNQYNIGGVTKIIENKAFIYFDGNHKNYEQQITAAIDEVLLNEMLFGSDFKARVANSTLLAMPEWFMKGLVSYLSDNWNVEIENYVKDGILSGKYEKFNRLTGQDAVYAGHSIWNFVAEKYGKTAIPNIIYLTHITKNPENGFLTVLGTSLKNLSMEWLSFYDSKYYDADQNGTLPDSGAIVHKPKTGRVYSQAKLSPDGRYVAYTTNDMGKYRLFLYDLQTDKQKRILRREHRLDQITDYTYPVIAWHPTSQILSFIIEEKGGIWLYFYEIASGNLDKKQVFYFDKILSYDYSSDGFDLILSAMQKGQTDLFIYNIPGNTNERLTNDFADDFDPQFIHESDEIAFASTRSTDTLSGNEIPVTDSVRTSDIFVYDYASRNPVLTRITNTPHLNETAPMEYQKNTFLCLSDENGIVNRFIAKYDSTISFIDTALHYRYFTISYPVTNYKRNILEQNTSPVLKKYTEAIYFDGKYHLYTGPVTSSKNAVSGKFLNTSFRKKMNARYEKYDSLARKRNEKRRINQLKTDSIPVKIITDTIPVDTTNINIRNYIFDKEKRRDPNKTPGFLPNADSLNAFAKDAEFIMPRPRMYMPSFYTNYFVSQIDFGFLNSSYQTFTGGEVYFNPGFNLFFKIGTNDLFEDYKLTGGFRFAGNFDSNEYLLSLENLKKRIDKQYIFHRQSFVSVNKYSVTRTHSHELMYIMNYPFSQVSALKGTLSMRYDRTVYLSTDLANLNRINDYKIWGGAKLEYIFDNTINRGLNLYNGTRYKAWGEFYHQIDSGKTDLFVLGFDFRHYFKIHRNMILASRVATSTSFGHNKLIYYLGSEDNWINLSPKVATFDTTVRINQDQHYAYQTLATNMRGFTQNIRNGNSFFVINNEIRWPIIRYFANRPINSDFLTNFQIIGFLDVGSAWAGASPYSKENAYNSEIINRGDITIIIDKERNPIVFGYGFGLRSRLLGYFVRVDWAWGVENDIILPRIFYLSLSLDF